MHQPGCHFVTPRIAFNSGLDMLWQHALVSQIYGLKSVDWDCSDLKIDVIVSHYYVGYNT